MPGSSGEGYRVFTPFHRTWRDLPLPDHVAAPRAVEGPRLPSEGLGRLPGGDPPIPAGPAAARRRLVAFVARGRRRLRAPARPRRRGGDLAAVRLPAPGHVHAGPDRPRAGPAGAPDDGARGVLAPGLLARLLPPPPRAAPEGPAAGAAAGHAQGPLGRRRRRPRGLGGGRDRLPARRRGHAPARRGRLDPQPRPPGRRLVPGEGPAGRLAPRRDRLHAGAGGRRPGEQQRRLAVDRGHRDRRGALLPRPQPGAPGAPLRRRRRLRAPPRPRAARRAGRAHLRALDA